jgi:hypothetical protein
MVVLAYVIRSDFPAALSFRMRLSFFGIVTARCLRPRSIRIYKNQFPVQSTGGSGSSRQKLIAGQA